MATSCAADRAHNDPHLLQMVTTEHFALQTARAATIAEANGRTSLFINAVAAAVVATAFVGQAAPLRASLYGFILGLLPFVFFLGLVTFVRLLDTSMYDMSYAQRISRLRAFYRDVAPEFGELLSSPIAEDPTQLPPILRGGPFWWRSLLSSAGVVEVVNSALAAVFAGVVAAAQVALPPFASIGLAGVTFVLILAAHLRYQVLRWQCARQLS